MSNTILITGASGNIGSALLKQLGSSNAKVIAGSSTGKPVPGVETRHVDLASPATLPAAFAGIDTLFLLLPLQKNMTELAKNAIDAAKTAGVQHIVRSSGAGADAASPVAIARVQGEIDQMVMNSGLAYTITRPTSFMQNYINFYGAMIKAGALYLPQADGKISLVDVSDIAAVNALILQNPAAHAGQIYTLTGPVALSNRDIADRIGLALNKKIDYVSVPDQAAIEAMQGMGMDAWNIEVLMSLNQIIAAGYTAGISDDVGQLLGTAPVGFDQFVQRSLAAWQ